MNINAVVLTGNLTSDPELRQTPSGTSVCGMRIAVNGREKVDETWRDRADFFDVRAWGREADNCAQYLKRGSPVAISGVLRLEEWTPKGGEQKRSRVLIVARSVQFLSRRGDGEGRESAAFVPDANFDVPTDDFGGGGDAGGDFAPTVPDDDIPF